MTRYLLGMIAGVLLTEYRWRRRTCPDCAERERQVQDAAHVLRLGFSTSGVDQTWTYVPESDDDGIQPPDPWPSSMASFTVRCTCMPNLGYVGIATCPVHNAQVSYTGGVGQ